MKRSTLFVAGLLFAASAVAAPARAAAQAQASAETEVRGVIDRMFDAMRRGDAAAMGTVFDPTARLQSVGMSREGQPALHTDSIAAFLRIVGAPHTQVYDERISDVQIRVDGNFATAWMNYSFYVVTNGAGQLSHCGVNAFHFFHAADGWKVTQITDTRRREGCPELPAGSR